MGRVSRRRIDPEVEERIFEIFMNYVSKLKSNSEVEEFLVSLLSYTEKVMIAKRLAIAVLLKRGKNYEYIDQTLKVSKSTVGTVHKQLLIGAVGYEKAVHRIEREEKYEKFWNKLEELFLKHSLPKAYGSPGWKKKSEEGKKIRKIERRLNSL